MYYICVMKNKKYIEFNCVSCNKEIKTRYDYYKNHSKKCTSCSKKNNSNAKKHGMYKSRIYKIWQGLFFRRYNKKINVCNEWLLFENFKDWSIKNGYSQYLTIDRINNELGYSPNNCQWITLKENAAKDKIIFNDNEKIKIYKERKRLKLTQREYALLKKVSRNTIQRAEKYVKQLNKQNK